jgi:hypothetical protein
MASCWRALSACSRNRWSRARLPDDIAASHGPGLVLDDLAGEVELLDVEGELHEPQRDRGQLAERVRHGGAVLARPYGVSGGLEHRSDALRGARSAGGRAWASAAFRALLFLMPPATRARCRRSATSVFSECCQHRSEPVSGAASHGWPVAATTDEHLRGCGSSAAGEFG